MTDTSFEISPEALIQSYRAELTSAMDRVASLRAASETERARRLGVEAQLAHVLGELPAFLRSYVDGITDDDIEIILSEISKGADAAGVLAGLDPEPEPEPEEVATDGD